MTAIAEAWPANLPRPMRLFTPPEPVQAMAEVPDYPPLWFIWRGQRRTVRHADGPERIHHEWWHSKNKVRQTRDYFRVEDEDGGRYWLFRDHRRNTAGAFDWFIHGVFA
jgi:protein ImuB